MSLKAGVVKMDKLKIPPLARKELEIPITFAARAKSMMSIVKGWQGSKSIIASLYKGLHSRVIVTADPCPRSVIPAQPISIAI